MRDSMARMGRSWSVGKVGSGEGRWGERGCA